MRRLLSVAAVVAFRPDPVAQAASLLGISAAYALLLWAWKPYVTRVARISTQEDAYKFDVFNDFEKYGTFVHLAVQSLALYYAADDSDKEHAGGAMDSIIAICVGVTVLIFALALVAHCLRAGCCGSARVPARTKHSYIRREIAKWLMAHFHFVIVVARRLRTGAR